MIDAQTLVEMQDRFDELAREGWPARTQEIRRERNELAAAICSAKRGDVSRTLETRADVADPEKDRAFNGVLGCLKAACEGDEGAQAAFLRGGEEAVEWAESAQREREWEAEFRPFTDDDRDWSPGEFDEGEGDFID